MKLKRYNVDGELYREGFVIDESGEWCLSEDVAALEAENETLKEHLADTRRMLLWLRNHYELYDYKRKDAKTFRAKVIARVDKIIPSDDSEPDYSDIPHKGIHP